MDFMLGQDRAAEGEASGAIPSSPRAAAGLQIQPFLVFASGWATLCGALSSGAVRWAGETLLPPAIAFLLSALCWGGIWALVSATHWGTLRREGRAGQGTGVLGLPYTQPHSLAGRLGRALARLAGWWKGVVWPQAGACAVLGLLLALLAMVLSLALPTPVQWMNLAAMAVVVLGRVLPRVGGESAAQSILHVGLPWLAGYLSLDRFRWQAVLLGLLFSLAAWGVLQAAKGTRGGGWQFAAGMAASAVLLAVEGQPLAAGGVGILGCGPVLSFATLRFGGDPVRVARKAWPWLLAGMLLAGWASP